MSCSARPLVALSVRNHCFIIRQVQRPIERCSQNYISRRTLERTFPYSWKYSELISMYIQIHRSVKYCAAGAKSLPQDYHTVHEKRSDNNCSTFSHLSLLFHESVVCWFTGKNPLFADTVENAIPAEHLTTHHALL
jgi:hypothetical protein